MKKAKIIVLSGQSNAVGVGHVKCLPRSFSEEKIAEYLNGYDNIKISFYSHDKKSDGFTRTGKNCTEVRKDTLGPEIGMAEYLNEKFPDEEFFIVKFAVGGASLMRDFLPPSSGGYYNPDEFKNEYDGFIDALFNAKPLKAGWCYSGLVRLMRDSLSDLKALGYADYDEPTSISVYLLDFAAKERFMDFIDAYNANMEDSGREELVIRYTDITGIMMSSVRTIVDSVSYVLIAFVAVSLVVSSIMIGIITYISVMERTKEIGILRAIGASKRNIAQVFNAETFIIGMCSGLLGVGVSLLLLIPINEIIYILTDMTGITAQLPAVSAVILILLSIGLTLLGGLIPSKQAVRKDPVIALRSE